MTLALMPKNTNAASETEDKVIKMEETKEGEVDTEPFADEDDYFVDL